MARKDRKIHKKRGSRTSGHGHHNKNRNAGNRGGKGLAGTHKGRWTWVVKYAPNHFGGYGFTQPSDARNIYASVNVGTLDESVEDLIAEGLALKKGQGYEIDLTKTDYEKVLGSGRVINSLTIKAAAFTPRASEKIEAAGGKAIPVNEESG